MATTVSFRVDDRELEALLRGRSGAVVADLDRRGARVQNRARALAPVDRGALRNSITREIRMDGTTPVCRIGTNLDYAPYVHEGTGIYGPRGTPIRPVSAKILRFPVRGRTGASSRSQTATGFVFAREVKGTPARPFLRDAMPAAAG